MRRALPVFLLLAAGALAQENPPAEKTAPPPDNAIAGAKRDFDAVKAARGSSEQAKAGLPMFAPPEIPIGASNPRPQKTKKTELELKAEKKSANWLVDAMMKKDEKDEKDEREPFEKNAGPLADDRTMSKRIEEKEKTSEKPDQAKTGPEFNPLTRYMSGWMTPQDYSLLKPGTDGPSAASLMARGDTSLAAPAADLAPTSGSSSALDLMALSRVAPAAAQAPAENPYLLGFTPPPSSMASFSAPSSSAMLPAAPAASVFTPIVDPPAEKSRIPDFAKPPADEKYFKQLKRF